MKKFICLFLVALFTLLTACSSNSDKTFRNDVTCEDIMNAVLDATNPPESEEVYKKSSDNLDSNILSIWADGLYEECKEFNLLSDYAIYVSAGVITYEIAVFKTDSTDDIINLFERRKENLGNGQKGMYDPMFETRMSSSKIETVGEFAVLLITDDNDSALDAIEKLK